MAFRLGDLIEWGELMNLRPSRTHGVIKLLGREAPCIVELTGDFAADLRGKRIRFAPRKGSLRETHGVPEVASFHPHQIGPTGTMTAARRVRTLDSGEWKRCLYLEWHSQNGRVLIELADPDLEVAAGCEGNDEPDWVTLPEPDLEALEREDEETGDDDLAADLSDFHEAFSPPERPVSQREDPDAETDLQGYLDAQSRETDRAAGLSPEEECDEDDDPDADAAFLRELEFVDCMLDSTGGDGEPVNWLFEELGNVEDVDTLSDGEAEQLLKCLLAQLALFGIALHMCEHYTPQKAIVLLTRELELKERVSAEMGSTGWVQNFLTSEHCTECEAEMGKN